MESTFLLSLECSIRTFLARCSALQVRLPAARDADLLDLCRHDVDLLGLCHRGVDLCHHRDGRCVGPCLRVACAQAQRNPQASR